MKVIIMRSILSRFLGPSSPDRPVYVCHGKDCRKKQKHLCTLRRELSEHGEVVAVRCQKICKGPVAGLEIDGRIEWFSKLGNPKSRKGLIRFLATGELRGFLKQRISTKRSGKLRTKQAQAAK